MQVEFDDINNVVILAMGIDLAKEYHLREIGNWYLRFLRSDEKAMILSLPEYRNKDTSEVYNYLKYFSLTYKLLQKERAQNLATGCLFDVFQYESNKKLAVEEYILNHNSTDGEVSSWGNGTITNLSSFLPVFKREQLDKSNISVIYNTFKLFSAIRKLRLIEYPIIIDFEEDLTLFLSSGEGFDYPELITFNTLKYQMKMDEESVASLVDSIPEDQYSQKIFIEYPYRRNIHNWLLDIGEKKFRVSFNNRFFNNELSKNEVFLLPSEYNKENTTLLKPINTFTIFNTKHNQTIYDILSQLKIAWRNQEFNKFITPFPKYWFMFISKGLSKAETIEHFREVYPAVCEKPIIKQIENLISELHELDWISLFIKEHRNPTFLFSEMSGLKGKRLSKIYAHFQNHVFSLSHNAKFISSFQSGRTQTVFNLDSFNITEIINYTQGNLEKHIENLVPDFLYFGYQPWIKYHLMYYQGECLVNEIREKIDPRFKENSLVFSSMCQKIIKEIIFETSAYKTKYNILQDTTDDTEEQNIELFLDSDDLEPSNEEEYKSVSSSISKRKYDVLVTTPSNKIFQQPFNTSIYIQRNTVIKAKVKHLNVGDLFLLSKDLNDIINNERVFNKLSEIPNNVINYQEILFNKENVFERLKNKSISLSDEKYFNRRYLLASDKIASDTFIIPRSKNDWRIICEFLSIDENAMNLTFIAYYGRKKKNELKGVYQNIIQLLIENDWLGEIGNPEIIKTVVEIITQSIVFEDKVKPVEIAESIIDTIINEIRFEEVSTIEIIEYE